MGLNEVMTISGMSGLYKRVAQAKSGFIVESLADHKRFTVHSTQRVSILNDISIFTTDDDLPLKKVLIAMKKKTGNELPVSPKSDPVELKNYFKSVVPNFDQDRVYISDIKKIISWYNLLKDDLEKENEEEINEEAAVESKEISQEEKKQTN